MEKKKTYVFTDAEIADFEEAFELFDKDGDRTMSAPELKNLLRCFGKKASDKDVKDYITRHSSDGEEEVDFEGFKNIMAEILTSPDYDEEIV